MLVITLLDKLEVILTHSSATLHKMSENFQKAA